MYIPKYVPTLKYNAATHNIADLIDKIRRLILLFCKEQENVRHLDDKALRVSRDKNKIHYTHR